MRFVATLLGLRHIFTSAIATVKCKWQGEIPVARKVVSPVQGKPKIPVIRKAVLPVPRKMVLPVIRKLKIPVPPARQKHDNGLKPRVGEKLRQAVESPQIEDIPDQICRMNLRMIRVSTY